MLLGMKYLKCKEVRGLTKIFLPISSSHDDDNDDVGDDDTNNNNDDDYYYYADEIARSVTNMQRGANRLRVIDVVSQENLHKNGSQGRRRCV